MENRDRDKMSHNEKSSSTGNVNRSTSPDLDRSKGDSQVDFGKNIGRSEDISSEPSRRSGSVDSSGMKGSTGRSSSSKSDSESESGVSGDRNRGGSQGSSGSSESGL